MAQKSRLKVHSLVLGTLEAVKRRGRQGRRLNLVQCWTNLVRFNGPAPSARKGREHEPIASRYPTSSPHSPKGRRSISPFNYSSWCFVSQKASTTLVSMSNHDYLASPTSISRLKAPISGTTFQVPGSERHTTNQVN